MVHLLPAYQSHKHVVSVAWFKVLGAGPSSFSAAGRVCSQLFHGRRAKGHRPGLVLPDQATVWTVIWPYFRGVHQSQVMSLRAVSELSCHLALRGRDTT